MIAYFNDIFVIMNSIIVDTLINSRFAGIAATLLLLLVLVHRELLRTAPKKPAPYLIWILNILVIPLLIVFGIVVAIEVKVLVEQTPM
jgi:hypothetical protein